MVRLFKKLSWRIRPKLENRVVQFLYSTTRKPMSSGDSYFSGERNLEAVYGAAQVRVPEEHRIGKIELPFKVKAFSLTFYEEAVDPEKHFIIDDVEVLPLDDWRKQIGKSGPD